MSSGMTNPRKPPRWTIAFLRALERCGEVEAAARDAGIDKTTAYARRKAHADFAGAWDDALRLRSGRTAEEVQERVGFWEKVKGKIIPSPVVAAAPLDRLGMNEGGDRPSPQPAAGSHRPVDDALPGDPASGIGGKEELLASTALGGKLVRAGPGRWNAAAEKRFFAELAATANVSRAAEAAGVSKNAVYARRMKRADFRAKWDAVLETGRSAIEMHLVEAARKGFDADGLDVPDGAPKVSVAEAIRIVQLHGSKAQARAVEPEPEMGEEHLQAVRQRLFDKLQRLRKRNRRERLEQGWSYDEAYDEMVPPGWVRDPDGDQVAKAAAVP